MSTDLNVLTDAFELYRSFVDYTINLQNKTKTEFMIPALSEDKILKLCNFVHDMLKNDQPLVTANFPCAIVGDLHGNLFDLVRIISKYGYPIAREYIFLGDYIDRGQFSLETVVFVLLLKFRFPRKVHILRGNHEFPSKEGPGMFRTELQEIGYSPAVYDAFQRVFEEIPVAVLLSKDILCVHGGIGPDVSLEAIRMLKYPLNDKKNAFAQDLLWSDPSEIYDEFEPSPRGKGWLFGKYVCNKFLHENNLKRIIRGHSFIETGYKSYFNGGLITIYSTSRTIKQPNIGATLLVKSLDDITVDYYDPLQPIYRSQVQPVYELPKLLPLPEQRERRQMPVVPIRVVLVRRNSLTPLNRK